MVGTIMKSSSISNHCGFGEYGSGEGGDGVRRKQGLNKEEKTEVDRSGQPLGSVISPNN